MSTTSDTLPAGADYPLCALCGASKGEHTALERSGELHHRWGASRSAGLDVVETNMPQSRPDPAPSVIIAPAPDLVLRKALFELGVLTEEQYKQLWAAP